MATSTSEPSTWHKLNEIFDKVALCQGLIALAALSSPTSQMTLAPVYGSTPSSINHSNVILATFLVGIGFQMQDRRTGSRTPKITLRSLLPVIAVMSSIFEHNTFMVSESLGVIGGPVVGGLISCHLILFAVAYEVSSILSKVSIDGIPSAAQWISKSAFAFVSFVVLERFFASQLPVMIAHSGILTPADVQLVIAASFALLCGDNPVMIVGTWILIILQYSFNPQGNGSYATWMLESSLSRTQWILLDRQWSTTGYVSVLENQQEHYRALRCDHSLLGGEWLINDERRSQGWTSSESIYSVFTMLDAVRLMKTDLSISDESAQALVIGLGIGTAPKSLIGYGIDTTIVELDPAVYSYAKTYFGLPNNHTIMLKDATSWVHKQAAKDVFDMPRYDYIIHDVFTGGVEPLSLFTTSFLQDLRSLLKDDGRVAINYAGDLNLPLTRTILNTIDRAFDRQCVMYSDDAARVDGKTEPFSNFVVFCRNSPGEVSFRRPTMQDFQGSVMKRTYLYPKAEQRVDFPLRGSVTADTELLETKSLGKWRSAQEKSAKQHWQIMRTMIPARIWEMY